MSDPTAFITLAEVQVDLSALTTTRLEVTSQRLLDACSAVVSLHLGAVPQWPAAIPYDWKRQARQWLAAQLACDFPEYFRFDGAKRLEMIEASIARRARVEPTENVTYVGSKGSACDAWDLPTCSCGGGCGSC